MIIVLLVKMFKGNKNNYVDDKLIMLDFTGKNILELEEFAKEKKLNLDIKYEYNDEIEVDKIITQSILKDEEILENEKVEVLVSLGKLNLNKLKTDGINELGEVPIMMYHEIVNIKNLETKYTGGNVDKDGYNRTTEAFYNDLEMYYEKGYRMIRLIDYVNGNIVTEYGKSPIVLTFDDGNENNIKVTGLDKDGNIIIDENSAVGILEQFKKKYPDFNVTATFFLTSSLFNQEEYNEKIIEWLVSHGYDIGNHTASHNNLQSTTINKTKEVIAQVYQKLDKIIPEQYVNILALPYGNPTNKNHENFAYIVSGSYEGYDYLNEAVLRVGWKPEVSPYNKGFDKTYIKRCRAYDNNGKDFDIEMVFNNLDNNRYISDGFSDMIVIPSSEVSNLRETDKKIIEY